jgi:hypothetical protein
LGLLGRQYLLRGESHPSTNCIKGLVWGDDC